MCLPTQAVARDEDEIRTHTVFAGHGDSCNGISIHLAANNSTQYDQFSKCIGNKLHLTHTEFKFVGPDDLHYCKVR